MWKKAKNMVRSVYTSVLVYRCVPFSFYLHTISAHPVQKKKKGWWGGGGRSGGGEGWGGGGGGEQGKEGREGVDGQSVPEYRWIWMELEREIAFGFPTQHPFSVVAAPSKLCVAAGALLQPLPLFFHCFLAQRVISRSWLAELTTAKPSSLPSQSVLEKSG